MLIGQSFVYVAYGSNMNRSQMSFRCPGAEVIGYGSLPNWRLEFRAVADIEPDPHFEVPVVAWRINRDHLAALDRYEGFPHLYTRKRLAPFLLEHVAGFENGRVIQNAFAYVMVDGMQRYGRALPVSAYARGIMDAYVDFGLPLAPFEQAYQRAEFWSDGGGYYGGR